jgi:hypothetical protein
MSAEGGLLTGIRVGIPLAAWGSGSDPRSEGVSGKQAGEVRNTNTSSATGEEKRDAWVGQGRRKDRDRSRVGGIAGWLLINIRLFFKCWERKVGGCTNRESAVLY